MNGQNFVVEYFQKLNGFCRSKCVGEAGQKTYGNLDQINKFQKDFISVTMKETTRKHGMKLKMQHVCIKLSKNNQTFVTCFV